MNISAFVFAAGLGTRLYPLTADRPKALVKYQGEPLLKIVLDKIIAAGIHDVVVNVHHFPDQIIDFLKKSDFEADIRVSDERAYLRDTAGGVLCADGDIYRPEGRRGRTEGYKPAAELFHFCFRPKYEILFFPVA